MTAVAERHVPATELEKVRSLQRERGVLGVEKPDGGDRFWR